MKQVISVIIAALVTIAWLPQAQAMSEHDKKLCQSHQATYVEMPRIIKSANGQDRVAMAALARGTCDPTGVVQTEIYGKYGDITANFQKLAGVGINIKVDNERLCQQFFMKLPPLSEDDIQRFMAILLSYFYTDNNGKPGIGFAGFATHGRDARDAIGMLYREAVKALTVDAGREHLHIPKQELLKQFLSGGDMTDFLHDTTNSMLYNVLKEELDYCQSHKAEW